MGKKIKTVFILLILVFTALSGVFVLSKVIPKIRQYTDKKEYENIAENYVIIDSEPESPDLYVAEAESDETEYADDEYFPIDADYDELLSVNPDCIGWIYSEGTVINYPVVQGEDNYHYLDYGFNGSENVSGTIYLDVADKSTISENTNSVLYGHHMANGSMFASIDGYKSQDYYESHPVIYFSTPEANYRVEIYSCYISDSYSDGFIVGFSDPSDHEKWLEATVENSLIETDIVPGIKSKILTLTTCSYEFEDARCIVHGVLKKIRT